MSAEPGSVVQGRLLHVDLGTEELETRPVPAPVSRRFLGGRGLALHLLLDGQPPLPDPLGGDGQLVFAAGLLNGLPGPGAPKYSVAARSPLTGGIGESEAGGFWGPELRFCGFDAVVVRGRAARPLVLVVQDRTARLEEAGAGWEEDTREFQERMNARYPGARVLQIGPAGARQVRFANLVHDLRFFNGRNGLGAVMGARNLRAVVLRASRRSLDIPDAHTVRTLAREVAARIKAHPLGRSLHDLGTAAGMQPQNAAGGLPTRNWTRGTFDQVEAISGERLRERFLRGRHGCFACPVRCKRVVAARPGEGGLELDPAVGGPEYESLAALGSLCGVDDLALLCKANELCNRYGLDTISTGGTVAFAMQCCEEGLIGRQEVGYELRFGDGRALLRLIGDIACRRGFGDVLAEGSLRAARRIGQGAERFCHHARGQELPLHDARLKTGIGLQYALSPRGADHWIAQHDPFFARPDSPGVLELRPIGVGGPVAGEDIGPGKVRLFALTQQLCSAYDCLGVCTLAAVARSVVTLEEILAMVRVATGWTIGWPELLQAGERAATLARLFNLRVGQDASLDRLPPLFFSPLRGGPRDGTGALDPQRFAAAVQEYYQAAGWDAGGVPTAEKLAALGLSAYAAAGAGSGPAPLTG